MRVLRSDTPSPPLIPNPEPLGPLSRASFRAATKENPMLEFFLAVLILAGVAAYAAFLWRRRKQRRAGTPLKGWQPKPKRDDTARQHLP